MVSGNKVLAHSHVSYELNASPSKKVTYLFFQDRVFVSSPSVSQVFRNPNMLPVKDFCRMFLELDYDRRLGLTELRREGTVNKKRALANLEGLPHSTFTQSLASDAIKKCDCPPSALRKKLRETVPMLSEDDVGSLDLEDVSPEMEESLEDMLCFSHAIIGEMS